ncbi:Rare lipoprotein A precursor [hydrothermal vent metagenome]|uniref:Rare lipoprotein A n=1 Tax=hydrothermal vent metagenome TaxID=652676 RepID=A0A1W1CZB1_9ZZZZ
MKSILSILALMLVLFLQGCFEGYGYNGIFSATKYTSSARHKATMRSYYIKGKKYYPSYVAVGQVMRGISSWYGPNFHGKRTSNGERYNMYGNTAAHKTWPMDTMVRVRNLQNNKTVVVRINDRGPFVRGRVIDCSYSAGKRIGLDRSGIARVSIEVIGFAGKIESKAKIAKSIRTHTQTRRALSNFAIQVGAFEYAKGAYKTKKIYSRRYTRYRPIIKKLNRYGKVPLYRVLLMGFGSEQEAIDFRRKQNLNGAFIVRE